jgi:hypothetical protein
LFNKDKSRENQTTPTRGKIPPLDLGTNHFIFLPSSVLSPLFFFYGTAATAAHFEFNSVALVLLITQNQAVASICIAGRPPVVIACRRTG